MNLEKLVNNGRQYLSDCTAVAAVYTPAYALLEVGLAGMSHQESLDARLVGLSSIYLGLGSLISLGRNYSRKIFDITEDSLGKIRKIHDTLYLAATALVSSPLFYYGIGIRDLKQIVVGTVAGAALSAAVGAPMGYAIDWFGDLLGVKEAQHMPSRMKRCSSRVKKTIAAGLVAASVGLTGLVYHLVPDKEAVIQNYPEQH